MLAVMKWRLEKGIKRVVGGSMRILGSIFVVVGPSSSSVLVVVAVGGYCCFVFISSPSGSLENLLRARRQQQQQVVVEDPPTEEELVDDQPEAPVEEGATDVEGFPDGPHDTSVLSDFENHIALRVWNVEERPELKLSSHGRKMAKFGRPAPKIEALVVASGLSPLITCFLDTGDRGLMYAFVERWHKETSSFHLPVEEVIITLDDVASLLHLPVVGAFHSFELLHVDDAGEMLVELLEVSAAEARAETIQCHDSYVRLLWLRDVYELKIEACDWIIAV
ncbi:Protein MAIN-LIKE 1 [Glycine soja]